MLGRLQRPVEIYANVRILAGTQLRALHVAGLKTAALAGLEFNVYRQRLAACPPRMRWIRLAPRH
jgi:hypothetical protein